MVRKHHLVSMAKVEKARLTQMLVGGSNSTFRSRREIPVAEPRRFSSLGKSNKKPAAFCVFSSKPCLIAVG